MSADAHIRALLAAPTVEISGAILRLQCELRRRKDVAEIIASKPHVTLHPE